MPASSMDRRPERGDYAPYYDTYVALVPDGDITETLVSQLPETLSLLAAVDEKRAGYRYAPGKWTLKEVVGHVVDAEWIFTHRALWFARANVQPLPGMEQDEFVAAAKSERRSLVDLCGELERLRRAAVHLFRSFDEEALCRRGTASGCEFTVRSVPYIIAGHELHHRKVLIDRYL